MLSCFLGLCYRLIRSIDFLTYIFEPIPFKGITIEISALILGKVADAMSRAVTIYEFSLMKETNLLAKTIDNLADGVEIEELKSQNL
jgi:hypothetical protein